MGSAQEDGSWKESGPLKLGRGAHLVPEPLRLLLVCRQLLLPLLHVGVGLVQSRHQLGVAVLQGEELRLQVHLTDGAEGSKSGAAVLQDSL